MAQHDYDLANAAGASFRADANNALQAIATNNSGNSEPTNTFPYQWWADTTSGILKQRNAANSAWIDILTLSSGAAKSVDGAITSATTATTQSVGDNSTKVATTAYADAVGRDKIQPITASVGSNALTITINPTVLDFRSTTLGSGTVTTVSIPSAISTVISSGSTAGFTNGVQGDIVVAAINNAGTAEVAWTNLAGGQDLSETGLISTTAEGGAGGADSASTWYSTTARSNVSYRVIGLIRSTQATAGTWATAPSLIQGQGGQSQFRSASMVRLNTSNGYGSTNTRIQRFLNVVTNQGNDITYADSATLGASFTINSPGVYAITYQSNYNGQEIVGLSVDATATTAIRSLPAANVLSMAATSAANLESTTSWTGYLNAGSVVRPHSQGGAPFGTGAPNQFTIVRVA